ncbi:MAG: 5-oxoprolinase subunit PxpB [Rhodospirillaceae bacterium]
MARYALRPLGDCALTLTFPALTGTAGALQMAALADRIQAETEANRLPGLTDLIPAFNALTLCFDPSVQDGDSLGKALDRLITTAPKAQTAKARQWRLPACYDPSVAPDLVETAERLGLSQEQLVAGHSAALYDVPLIGFLPGFPFLSGTPQALHLPRRATPRTQVPAGSVAIANDQTAIYPWESPGGWHLIARCPVPLFNVSRPAPSLLAVGDQLRFDPISVADLESLQDRLKTGALAAEQFLVQGEAAA